MSENNPQVSIETSHELVSTLTPRETKVLLKRFGIKFGESDENDSDHAISFMPPSSGGGGHSGAPQSAIASPPFLPNEKDKLSQTKNT